MGRRRLFDHDEARHRHAAGESVASLANRYGVTKNAIYRLVSEKIAASDKRNSALYIERRRVPCETCGKPCLSASEIMSKRIHSPDGRSLCARCRNDERRTRLRFDENGTLILVRCSMADCASGERWQTPDQFTNGERDRQVRPGGISGQCRSCQTRARTNWRARNRERERVYEREYRREYRRRRRKAAE